MADKESRTYSGAEKRRFKRLNKAFVVRIRPEIGGHKDWDMVLIRNISKGGMCFITPDDIKVGAVLDFKINVKLNKHTIICKGAVIRARTLGKPSVHELGISFKAIADADGDLINSTVEALSKEPAQKPRA